MSMKKITNEKLIVTIGPSSLNDNFLMENLEDDFIFRINSAHVSASELGPLIMKIRKGKPQRKILVDVPGSKIRLKNIKNDIILKPKQKFVLDQNNFNFNIDFQKLKKGTIVLTNDSTTRLSISSLDINQNCIEFESKEDCIIRQGKGVHFVGINPLRDPKILNQKDIDIISESIKSNVDFIGVSFVRNVDDIDFVESLFGQEKINFFYKIETRGAIENLNEILDKIDYAILDRGDLSSEIGILNIFEAIKKVIATSNKKGVKLFVATQILSSLTQSNIPSISDVIDLQWLLDREVTGFQFSDETAIGKDPQNCIHWFSEIINRVN